MAFPSTFSTFPQPSTSSRLDNPSHSTLHNDTSSAIGQLEAVVGRNGDNSVAGTLTYQVQSPDSDGGGHVQTANKGGTGQTSYTKGDVLVAQSSSALSKLAIGTDDQVLIADSSQNLGLKWGATPVINVQSTIAASSVWTKPAAAGANSRVFVELWGGGGSGASAWANQGAGGGGGGAYVSGWFMASTLTSVLINVGKGGDSTKAAGAGLPGNPTVWDPINSILTAYGGGGGQQGNSSAGYGGGGGGLFQVGFDGGNQNGRGGELYGTRSFGDGTFIVNLGNGEQVSVVGRYSAPNGGGAAGGVSNSNFSPASSLGGNSFYGGAGGGASNSSIAGGSALGGISAFGGAGGKGSIILGNASAAAGVIPGGGGGAGWGIQNSTSSGEGAKGMARITTFL